MNRLARPALPFAATALMVLLPSCGGDDGASGPAPITVAVNPSTSTVYAGANLRLCSPCRMIPRKKGAEMSP
jgi:hypothetical protein